MTQEALSGEFMFDMQRHYSLVTKDKDEARKSLKALNDGTLLFEINSAALSSGKKSEFLA